MEPVKLIECPRDAWQGLPEFLPTEYKASRLAAVLNLTNEIRVNYEHPPIVH